MKKLLMILSMVLLVAAFVMPSNTLAQIPALLTPADNAQLTVNEKGSVTLDWKATATTIEYILQVADNSNFDKPIFSASTGSASKRTITGLPAGSTIYWRVRAYYEIFPWLYGWSDYSTAFTFRIIVPELLTPTNGAVNQSQPLNLTWRAIADPLIMNTGHQIWVDDNSDFSSPEISATTRGSSLSVSGLAYNTRYYWQVRFYWSNFKPPFNTIYYEWSSRGYFFTGCDIPTPPSLTAPANNATNQSQPVAMSWNAVGIATKYNFQLATNVSFSPAIKDNLITATTYNATNLEDGTQYYWRVRAGNECGWSTFTGTRNFTTECPAPPAPGQISPANGATGITMPFTIDWNDIADADMYRVQVDIQANFSNPIRDETPTSSEFTINSGLEDGRRYYWRVMTHNSCGWGAYGGTRSFDMACPTPAATTLELPINGASGLSQPVSLDWADALGATRYIVEIAFDAGFSELDRSVDASNSNYSASELATDGTTYYWRIKSGNECLNWSGWSSVWNFSTECVTAGAPSLVSPADGETEIDIRNPLYLDWNDIGGNTGYQLQVDDNDIFDSPVVITTPTGESIFNFEGELVAGTNYFWRVRTNNACGYGDWSDTWEFQPNCPIAGVVTLVSPINNASYINQPIELIWDDLNGATKYHVQVGDDGTFASWDVNEDNVEASTFTLPNLSEGITYYWRVLPYNGCQWGDWSSIWQFTPGEQTDVEIITGDQIPESFTLKQNYPNPFNPSTTIVFALPRASYVNLEILNILGERVETLFSKPMSAGSYSVIWDASNVPSGVYFYKINAGTFSETKKMSLIK